MSQKAQLLADSCMPVQNTSKGGMRNQIQKQLVDRHWILALQDAAAAQQAARMVTELSANLREHLNALLGPFLAKRRARGWGAAEVTAVVSGSNAE